FPSAWRRWKTCRRTWSRRWRRCPTATEEEGGRRLPADAGAEKVLRYAVSLTLWSCRQRGRAFQGEAVATPNYGYEKRQKELAKKRKKEDKLRAKAERKLGTSTTGLAPDDPETDVASLEHDPPTIPELPTKNG